MTRDLNDTLIFVKVVEQGSFIAAARSLGLPKTTVSRRIQELETRLGAQLLHRTTRRLGVTESGAVYFEHCQRIARELDEAESAVTQLQGGPRGWLRITTSFIAGNAWIGPLLGEFQERYPDLRVEMLLTNDKVDLISNEIDVALRGGSLPDSTLVARRLGTFRSQVFAAPKYIERYGEPHSPSDLANHRVLAYTKFRRNGRFVWPLRDGQALTDYPVDPIMVANDLSIMKGPLLSGDGIVMAQDILMRPLVDMGLVKRVMAGWTGPEFEFNAVFPKGRTLSPKVRVFIDFLVERLRFDADYMAMKCPCPTTAIEDEVVDSQPALALGPKMWPTPEPAELVEAAAAAKRRAA